MLSKKITICLAAGIIGLSSQQANAISITFDYSYDGGFFSSQSRKDTLNAAGNFFATHLTDSLSAITSAAGNSFNAKFSRPDNGQQQTISNYSVAADTIIIYAGGRNLGSSTLGVGGYGGFSAQASSQSFLDNLSTRGQGSNSTEFGPWGGSISFNNTKAWHFDSDVSTKENFSGLFDFYSVAIHELGHLLGIGTANSWDAQITNGQFTGAASVAINGGNVNLSSGLGHWAPGTEGTVDGNLQETAMDPNIASNRRKYFTDLDLAGLTDIGWNVTPVPVPAAVYLLGSALIGLIGFRRKN